MLTEQQALRRLKDDVPTENMMSVDDGNSYFIPIEVLEELLDDFRYGTQNFKHELYKDGYANLCVAASLELSINYLSEDGSEIIQRTFVGACNFPLNSLGANSHFLATAKSECVKNAAQDAGKWFGRGLNTREDPPDYNAVKKNKNAVVKKTADSKIMNQFNAAVESGDEATITMLSNIYEIKREESNAS